MHEHMVTFGYGPQLYRRKVVLTDGYTTRADIPNILGIAMGLEPSEIDVFIIDGEWV